MSGQVTTNAKKILSSLVGDWRLNRQLIHAKTKSSLGNASGIAKFSKIEHEQNKLNYEENTIFIIPAGKRVKASQHYQYWYNTEDDTIDIYRFDHNGMLFFLKLTFPDQTQEAKAIHYCQPDTYQAHYQFSKDSFVIKYNVFGPEKDYISTTELIR